MKNKLQYALIENTCDGFAVLHICKTKKERDAKTLTAIYGTEPISKEQKACAMSELKTLREDGILTFEGDPSLEWKTVVLEQRDCETFLKSRARVTEAAPELFEALVLADALLSGANMNRRIVQKKVHAALAKARGTSR